MRAYLALMLAFPITALAQTDTTTAAAGTVLISEQKDKDSVINQDECNNPSSDGLSYNWTLAKDGTALVLASGATVEVNLSISLSSTCPSPGGTVWSRTIKDVSSASSQYPSSGFDDLAGLKGDPLKLTCSGTSTQAIYVCVTATHSGTTYSAVGNITFDQTYPPPPVATALEPGEGALTVYYTVGTKTSAATADTVSYHAEATRSDKTGTPIKTNDFTGGDIRIEGLQNGVSYDVQVFAKNSVGNLSAGSNVKTDSPVPVNDFWKLYESQGGREEGGCASGPAGVFALLVPVFFALRRRRS